MKASATKIGIAYVIFLLLGLGATVRIIDLQFFHRPDKEVYTAGQKSHITLECTRGSILAADGRYLAFSIPEYKIAIDCCQSADSVFNNNIDALCDSLSASLHEGSASYYKKLLTGARNSGKRFLPLTKKYLTYHQMMRVASFPLLNKGQFGGGFMTSEYGRRQYPYGYLAYRTLGRFTDAGAGGIGIEGSCDSILKGVNGMQPIRRTEHRKWIEDYERERVEPVNGTDVRTTIDIDLQEIADRALRHQLAKTDEIEAGTVVVMETATGRIRAMVNLMKQKDGTYNETYNYAIGRKGEPGSVFKLATLCCLLENGKTTLSHEMPATVHFVYGKRDLVDHYLDKYSTISVLRGFEISSNNVFRMLAANNYGNDPAGFVDFLNDRLKISYNYKFDINGFAEARIKHPDDKSWAPVDLPQIGMGYASELTPMHTLCFYNAIANGGVMVKPHLIESFEKDGVLVKEFPTETIATVCSPSTVKQLHMAMRGVVTDGTGKTVFQGCPVRIAGKTGTARVVMDNGKYEMNGRKKHQATFAGFFPYDNPQYTVIAVVYSYPTIRNFYGATWGGPVVREIAEEMYASSTRWSSRLEGSAKLPEIRSKGDSCFLQGGVPDVRGMGLREAVSLLENLGYRVSVNGRGTICAQNPEPGAETDEKNVELFLNQQI